jgi:hypothetical protein
VFVFVGLTVFYVCGVFSAPPPESKMVCIRQATVDDLLAMQSANLWCLPENYQVRTYRLIPICIARSYER